MEWITTAYLQAVDDYDLMAYLLDDLVRWRILDVLRTACISVRFRPRSLFLNLSASPRLFQEGIVR